MIHLSIRIRENWLIRCLGMQCRGLFLGLGGFRWWRGRWWRWWSRGYPSGWSSWGCSLCDCQECCWRVGFEVYFGMSSVRLTSTRTNWMNSSVFSNLNIYILLNFFILLLLILILCWIYRSLVEGRRSCVLEYFFVGYIFYLDFLSAINLSYKR